MPVTPTPPQQPPVIVNPNPNPSPVQEVPVFVPVPGQPTQIQQPSSNEVNVDTPSNSSSVSEAENISSNAASLNAYQINSNHESTYYGYSNRVTVPGTSVYGDLSVINNSWDWGGSNFVGSVGLRHTFGGKAKSLALDSVRKDTLSKTLSVCDALGVFEGKVQVDYEMMPDLAPCQYISQRVVVQPTKTQEIKVIKQEMTEYKKLLENQKKDVDYYQQKINREYRFGAPVRVGG